MTLNQPASQPNQNAFCTAHTLEGSEKGEETKLKFHFLLAIRYYAERKFVTTQGIASYEPKERLRRRLHKAPLVS